MTKQLLILILGCLGCSMAFSDSHFVIGCEILDSKLRPIKQIYGHSCIFMRDGSWISAGYSDLQLNRFNQKGEKVWNRKLDAHHSLNISEDGKRLFVLSSEFVNTENCRARFDKLVVLDSENGQTLAEFSLAKNRNDFFKKYLNSNLTNLHENNTRGEENFSCRFTHFNTLREIPENSLGQSHPAFAKGNLIASIWDTSWVFIFDKDLKGIIWEQRLKNQSEEGIHDVQVLSDGRILFYNNKAPEEKVNTTKIQTYDVITKKTQTLFPKNSSNSIWQRLAEAFNPRPLLYSREMGGVQKVEDNYLFNINSDELGGLSIMANSKGEELWQIPYHHKDNQGKPAFFLDVKHFDLSEFLKNNKL